MKAIRIAGTEIVYERFYDHADLLVKYMEDAGLTEDQADDLIDAGLLEFGSMSWDPRTNLLNFNPCGTRADTYTSVRAVFDYS